MGEREGSTEMGEGAIKVKTVKRGAGVGKEPSEGGLKGGKEEILRKKLRGV